MSHQNPVVRKYFNLLGAITRFVEPRVIVDLGVWDGTSTTVLAENSSEKTVLHAFGDWKPLAKEFPFTIGSYKDAGLAIAAFQDMGVSLLGLDPAKIYLHDQDYVKAAPMIVYTDLLHINVCNCEANIRPILAEWLPRVDEVVVLEGGRHNRWQVKDGLSPYTNILDEPFIANKWSYCVLPINEYDAITIMSRRI